MDPSGPADPAHRCRLCGKAEPACVTICAACELAYGKRVARLLARAERDHDFALTCLAHLPDPLRQRFAALLGQRCFLAGADTRMGPGLRRAKPRPDPKWLKAAN
jgi:hypothetical protein